MNLSAPKVIVFFISLAVAILGLLGYYAGVALPIGNFHLMLVAWIILALGVMLKGF